MGFEALEEEPLLALPQPPQMKSAIDFQRRSLRRRAWWPFAGNHRFGVVSFTVPLLTLMPSKPMVPVRLCRGAGEARGR